MERSRSAFAALGLLVACALAGCSSQDPVPKVAPASGMSESVSPSDPASESATATPSGPETGQATFIDHFFRSVGEATTSGDASAFLELSSPACQNCRTLAGNIEGAYRDGGHVEGGGWKVKALSPAGETTANGTVWNVDVETSRERWFDGDDQLVKVVRPSVQHFGVLVAEHSGRLVLRDLRLRS